MCYRFVKRFRLSKDTFRFLLRELNLYEGIHITNSIETTLKLAVTLDILAKGGEQSEFQNDGLINMSQRKVTAIFNDVINIMEKKLCAKYIQFKVTDKTQAYFFSKYKIPGVVGCISGTHIKIVRPQEDDSMYSNRKGEHSLNVMMVEFYYI